MKRWNEEGKKLNGMYNTKIRKISRDIWFHLSSVCNIFLNCVYLYVQCNTYIYYNIIYLISTLIIKIVRDVLESLNWNILKILREITDLLAAMLRQIKFCLRDTNFCEFFAMWRAIWSFSIFCFCWGETFQKFEKDISIRIVCPTENSPEGIFIVMFSQI